MASRAQALPLSGLLAASSAHDVAAPAARPYMSHAAYLRPREVVSAGAAASAGGQPAGGRARAPRAHLSAASRMAVRHSAAARTKKGHLSMVQSACSM